MNRWVTFLGALALVFTLWTGSAAHAGERFDCIPVAADSAGHFDGDQDQSPSSPDGVAHHHSGCSGHQLAAASANLAVEHHCAMSQQPFAWREAGVPGRGPDADLRPPIV